MKKKQKKLYFQQKKRYLKKIVGTLLKPRLSVFRSHKHIYAQLIDDKNSQTLAFSSTNEKEFQKIQPKTATKEAAFLVGKSIAQKAFSRNISTIVFDRSKKIYHGRIKELAQGARLEGLIF